MNNRIRAEEPPFPSEAERSHLRLRDAPIVFAACIFIAIVVILAIL
jgi:preprotein translocase subunit Sec61beta